MLLRSRIFAIVAVGLIPCVPAAAQACDHTDYAEHAFVYDDGALTDLGTLGGNCSNAVAINDSGQIAGDSTTSTGQWHAFRYSNGVMTDLGTLGGSYSSSIDINAGGQVAGSASTGTSEHAFLYSGGAMIDLGTLGGTSSRAVDLNDAGQVAGNSSTGTQSHAFLYSGGVMTDLGTLGGGMSEATAINEAGEVVGFSTTAGGETHAFRYSAGVMTDLGLLPGGTSSRAYDLNDSGVIVGAISTTSAPKSFQYSGEAMTELATNSIASRVNASGQVVLLGYFASGNTVYPQNSGLYSEGMAYIIPPLDLIPPEYEGEDFEYGRTAAAALNDDGQVVGSSSSMLILTGGGWSHAFLYDAGATIDLGTLGAGWNSSASAINDSGQVVGTSDVTPCPRWADEILTERCMVPTKSTLTLVDSEEDTKDQIKWKWSGSPAVAQADFGDPSGATRFWMCLYGNGELKTLMQVDPGAAWTSKDPKGWIYKDPTGAEDGVLKASVKPGEAGKSKVQFVGGGIHVPFRTYLLDEVYYDYLEVVLVNSTTNACWKSDFSVSKVNGSKLTAKYPAD
jgi:probable HAF family extracellular repeat protein